MTTQGLKTSVAASSLPDLDAADTVTPEQAQAYRRDGHVLLRGVASPAEVAAYRPEIVRAADQYNTETRAMADRDTYAKACLQIMNLWARDEAVRRFTLAKRFGKIASDLVGVDGVRLYHD